MPRIVVRIGKAVILIVVVVGALGGALAYAMSRHFNTAPPHADYPKPASDLEAQRQDLGYFRKLIALDRSYEPAARMEAERRIAALESLDKALDHPHFRVALMKILALADNGHTHLDLGNDANSRKLPVRLAVFSDGLYVMRTTDANSAVLGGRVVAIDGKPIDVVMERLAERGSTAQVAIRVHIRECFFHCAKAFIRSQLWHPEKWPDRRKISWGKYFANKIGLDPDAARKLDEMVEHDYKHNL